MAVRPTLLAVALLFLVGACGGSSGPAARSSYESGAEPTTSTTSLFAKVDTSGLPDPQPMEPILRADVQTFLGSYFYGDAESAYRFLSKRCQRSTDADDFREQVRKASAAYEDLKIDSYAEKIDGDQARVSYELSYRELNETNQRWVLEASGWRKDDC